MTQTLTGGCLCGAIRYTVNAPITRLRACHCKDCQKTSGASGSVNAIIARADLDITHGTPKRYVVTADSGRTLYRHFCGDCGSLIYGQPATRPDVAVLRVGTLDNPGDMKITANIWTQSARPWAHIDPTSEQHPGQPEPPAAKN